MTKIEAYKEVSNVVEMIELILKKFHNDMVENHIVDGIFCPYEEYFTIFHPIEGHINSNDTFTIIENGEYVLKMLNITNKYTDLGWGIYLTALKLGIEKISNLMGEDEE